MSSRICGSTCDTHFVLLKISSLQGLPNIINLAQCRPNATTTTHIAFAGNAISSSSSLLHWAELPANTTAASAAAAATRRSILKSECLLVQEIGGKLYRNENAVNCSTQDLSAAENLEAKQNQLQLKHNVSVDVAAPVELVWCMWNDLQNMPSWMRWIDRVELLEDGASSDSELKGVNSLSRWFCSTPGFEVSWTARIDTIEITPSQRILRWVTIEGLQSVGEVSFTENGIGTRVELRIDHSFPHSLGQVMDCEALKSLIEATLQSDLERFHKYALKAFGAVQSSN